VCIVNARALKKHCQPRQQVCHKRIKFTATPGQLPQPPNQPAQGLRELFKPSEELLEPFQELFKPFQQLFGRFQEFFKPSEKHFGRLQELVWRRRQLLEPSKKLVQPLK
jgi:hypothetical protein